MARTQKRSYVHTEHDKTVLIEYGEICGAFDVFRKVIGSHDKWGEFLTKIDGRNWSNGPFTRPDKMGHWCTPAVANAIHALRGPHGETWLKVWLIRNG